MNRPLLGIYSDEGVGYEHGGPRHFSMRAFSNELRHELGYSDDVANGQANFYPPSAFVAPSQTLRSFVVSDPFASMDVQRNELANKQKEFQESAEVTTSEGDEPEDEVSARIAQQRETPGRVARGFKSRCSAFLEILMWKASPCAQCIADERYTRTNREFEQ
eukprot:scaffold3181_cov167-Amphora_coffeaeformis.AAC.3